MQEREIILLRHAELSGESSSIGVGMQHDGGGPLDWLSLGALEADESCPDGMDDLRHGPLKKSFVWACLSLNRKTGRSKAISYTTTSQDAA